MLKDINVWFKFEKAEIHAVGTCLRVRSTRKGGLETEVFHLEECGENVETRKTKGMMEAHKD